MKVCVDCGKEKKCNSGTRCRKCACIRNVTGKHWKHSDSWKRKMSAALKGKPLSKSHKKALSEAHTGVPLSAEHSNAIRKGQNESPNKYKMAFWKGKHNPSSREAVIKSRKRGKHETSIERKVKEFLVFQGYQFEQEFYFRALGILVDFYLPLQNKIIECDGTYWHSLPGRQEKDKERDVALSRLGIMVLRLPEKSIKGQWDWCQNQIIALLERR